MPEAVTAKLLNKLQRVKSKSGGGWIAACPVAGHNHNDRNPSLSIDERDGKILLSCFTGHTAEDVASTLGLTLADLFLDSIRHSPAPARAPIPFRQPQRGEMTALYDYRDHTGRIVAQKGRFDLPDGKKSFLWRPAGIEGWPGLESIGLHMTDLALWGSELLTPSNSAELVYFCEGEKSALACRAAGLLAVTFAGGASTRDFGAALEILTDRKVALWPDNDGPGREYMQTVESRLRGRAAALSTVSVPLPLKGDAWDYFDGGGLAADLPGGSIALAGPAVEFLSADSLRVIVPSAAGRVVCTLTDIERSTRAFDVELTIEIQEPGFTREPYSERVNTLSSSATDTLRRSLEQVYGKEHGWTRLLNIALGTARKAFLGLDRSIDVADIEDQIGDLFFCDPFLPDRSPTIWFGDGSSLKSLSAFEFAFCTSLGLPFLGRSTREGGVLVLDYEDNEANFKRRMRRIALGHDFRDMPGNLVRYFPAHGVPLRDLVPAIQKVIKDYGIILLIVDSVGPACGGEPERADVALGYFRALSRLGVTSLNIAHITKEAARSGNTQYPFGSMFWGNMARRTWFVAREQEEESDDLDIGFYCKKVNDGPRPRPVGIAVHFSGLHGAVTLQEQDIANNVALQGKRDAKSQVLDAIMGGLTTVKDIAGQTGISERAIQTVLTANPKLFQRVATSPAKGRGQPAVIWGVTQAQTPPQTGLI